MSMNMRPSRRLLRGFGTLIAFASCVAHATGQKNEMPRENVVDFPAIGEKLCLHNLFQSNMVLQRDKPIPIWGWASPGEKVSVSFAGQTKEAKAEKDRIWKVSLSAMEANAEPQTLTVHGKDAKLTLENVLIGDVWVLGGQSNMEEPLQHVENGQLEIVSANYPGIRILTLSAIGYVFARRLHMAAQMPIGVIDASRGGTTVETWTPTPVLKKIETQEVKGLLAEWEKKVAEFDPQKDLEKRVENHHNWVRNMKKQGREIPKGRTVPTDLRTGPAMDQNRPGNCFASMIAPLAGLSVKGAIFHQGYNNAGGGSAGADMYYQVFGKMITAWRDAFNDPHMPFGIISLCTAGEPQTRDDYLEKMVNGGIYIREAQYKTFLDFLKAGDEHIGFASSFDKRRSWYHPQLKVPVGERISRWALATQYGFDKDIKWKPPMYTEMKIEEGKIILKMDTWVRPVTDGPIVGFAIAGKDRRYQPAEAEWLVTGKDQHNRPKHDRRVIVLSSPHVPEPIHFRYAWGRNPMGNLQSAGNNDLPFATQRSDDWRMEDVPVQLTGFDNLPPKDFARRANHESKKALQLDDLGRRLKEAQTLIDQHKEEYEQERAAERKRAEEKK
jgi:sialate O-acetylesterase